LALVFIGFMGSGKSTAAAATATRLGVQALDSDLLLEEEFGHSITTEFQRNGEAAFREREEGQVCALLDQADPLAVIALGGGAVLSAHVRAALQAHRVVLLEVDPQLAWERARDSARPLARERERFLALYEQRRELYEEVADITVLWARAASGEYPVIVGRALLADPWLLSALWPLDRSVSRSFYVSDQTVAALHPPPVGAAPVPGAAHALEAAHAPEAAHALISIPPGERHKTLASAQRVWEWLAQEGATRADHLVALGGGVVGDLAGFCAATYQRGVPVVQLPTTVVAQVDSAYGGKTGVDLPQAKNYVGAYHQPAGVIVDPEVLQTLPAEELHAGWVEVLKTALIAGGELWQRVAAGGELDERMILACARTKLAVVAQDERDSGRRQVLNLGHTVGHAIETATGYTRYRHGEAVGLGLLAALRLSELPELRVQVRELLQARGLPVTLAGADVDDVVAMTKRDKKRLRESVPFVLVRAPGDIQIGCHIEPQALHAAVAELRQPELRQRELAG
jgi:shikimate kinase/3-dehydroquinate synthase